LVVCAAAVPRVGDGANELKPRVPVEWPEPPEPACMTIVDLPAAEPLHFDYAVAQDDLGPKTEDEVDDSRTHQFLAFARHPRTGTALPPWLGRGDVDRAADEDPNLVPEDVLADEVLEDHPEWSGSEWTKITADDERVPISMEQAAMGFAWDLDGAEPGVWIVAGYTFEPVASLWSLRPGVVKLRSAELDPPAAAIDALEDVLDGTEPITVTGCVDAVEGSTLELAWGEEMAPTVEPQWRTVVEDAPVEGDAFALSFDAPPEADGAIVRFRVRVRDPQDREWIGYSPGAVQVMGHADPPAAGCGCSGAPHDRLAAVWLLVFAPLVRRRRLTAS
jgi:MYXO-CTERM domain-containing protein